MPVDKEKLARSRVVRYSTVNTFRKMEPLSFSWILTLVLASFASARLKQQPLSATDTSREQRWSFTACQPGSDIGVHCCTSNHPHGRKKPRVGRCLYEKDHHEKCLIDSRKEIMYEDVEFASDCEGRDGCCVERYPCRVGNAREGFIDGVCTATSDCHGAREPASRTNGCHNLHPDTVCCFA